MKEAVSITTANGGQLSATKMGGTVSLLSFNPKVWRWEGMTYQNCLLVPNLVTNLIGTKSVTRAQGKVTFESELVTVQDKHGRAIHVPTSGDGYLAAAMLIWDDRMSEPAISLAFMASSSPTEVTHGTHPKANLWHHRLGHASHDSILQTWMVTLAHDILLAPAIHSGALCNTCVQSKATARTLAHPRRIRELLELVSMDVMGPLHGATQFAYVLIIHDTYSGMVWVRGLANKGQAAHEAGWWLSEVCVATHWKPLEVVIDHGIREV